MHGVPGTNPSQITTDKCISIISFNHHTSPKSWWNQDLDKLTNFSRFSIASKLQNEFILHWLAYKTIDSSKLLYSITMVLLLYAQHQTGYFIHIASVYSVFKMILWNRYHSNLFTCRKTEK